MKYIFHESGSLTSFLLGPLALKGHFCIQIDFFVILDHISRHKSKTPMFYLPKSWKMYLRQYWQNHQPVLAKTPTGIDQIANRY